MTNPKTYIHLLYFGSDELSCGFGFTDEAGKYKEEERLDLAYKIFKNVEDYKKPILYFINTCDENFRLAFTIEKLTRYSLELKCIRRDLMSEDILLNRETLKFEKTAYPPKKIRQRF